MQQTPPTRLSHLELIHQSNPNKQQSLRNLHNPLPPLHESPSPHLANLVLQPQPGRRPIRRLQRPYILLELSIPPVFGSFQQSDANLAIDGLRLRGLGFDEAVEQDRLLVQKGALV